jgi:hypothetical protein
VLAAAAAVVLGAGGTPLAGGATPSPNPGPSAVAGAASAAAASSAPLTLLSQTPWVTATAPWFNLSLGVGASAGAAEGLHVSITFYSRMENSSQLQEAINGTPSGSVLLRDDVPVVPAAPVTPVTPGVPAAPAMTAAVCVTVLPDESASPPATGAGACGPGSDTLVLGCTPNLGICGDVYPVTVELERQGSAAPLAHFTTFLTYQEPTAIGEGGRLLVGVVVPLATGLAPLSTALTAHHDVPTTLAVSPLVVQRIEQTRSRDGLRALAELAALSNDEVLDQPFVPINVAALSEAGITGEIEAQVTRGDELLRGAGLKPSGGGPWIDATSSFTEGDAADLATGVQVAGSSQLVLSDSDLAAGGLSNLTFAQPFTLDLGHGSTLPATVVDSTLSARFTAVPGDPVLGAEQLLAGLSFVHFENAFLTDPRGIVVEPPAGWQPSAAFLDTLLAGLTGNYALQPVTLSQVFAQVPVGGNHEPTTRRLQSGPATRGISSSAADRIALARQQLASWSAAVSGHPSQLTTLSDAILATEARALSPSRRSAALTAYEKTFAGVTGMISLATERTVTFTAQRAAIPITVLSSSPYPVNVVVTLTSDKFIFPDGNTVPLLLDRPTTSVRVTAQARTSGDRLPIEVTLHTPDGQLLISHTVLTVQSTAISFVGIALTVFAGTVLLVWWARTWRRSRRQKLRAH